MAEENVKQFKSDVIKHFDKKTEETKRHFDVVAEDLKGEIKTVAEQVRANAEKLEEHSQRFNKVDKNLGIIKIDIEFIKNELKQRVSLLEAKLNQ